MVSNILFIFTGDHGRVLSNPLNRGNLLSMCCYHCAEMLSKSRHYHMHQSLLESSRYYTNGVIGRVSKG